jgi:hypothetical protein
MKAFLTRAGLPLLVLRAFTALNRACSHEATFTAGVVGLGVGVGVGVGVVVVVVVGAVTETSTDLVVVPAALVDVRVYEVVTAGKTALLPDAATLPTPLLMDIEAAPVTLQLRLELVPFMMLVGLAVKELMTGKGAVDGAAAT